MTNVHILTDSDRIEHSGVRGMKWGVRRAAKKDANEYAKAKMFYGTGAGNRRKLINAKVTERSKDPQYKAEFERNLSTQDYAKRSSQAKRERARKDAAAGTAKTARGVKNTLLGNPQYASLAGLSIAIAAKYAHSKEYDKLVLQKSKVAFNVAKNSNSARAGMAFIKRAMG